MEDKEALDYVRDNLAIDLTGQPLVDTGDEGKIVSSFPYRGIVLCTGTFHLLKAGHLCYTLLRNDFISGSIDRYESWYIIEDLTSTELLIISNVSEDLIKLSFVIQGINISIAKSIPIIITTPLGVDELENSLPMSLLSNIVPYLYGKL